MKSSEQIDKISEALAKAQGQMVNPLCNKTVTIPGKYSFNYADLSAVIEAIRKPLADNGICHTATLDSATSILECRLTHSSGQFLSSDWALARNPDPKQMAGSITYAKRYLLAALVGIAADEDKDGEPEPNAQHTVIPPKVIPFVPKFSKVPTWPFNKEDFTQFFKESKWHSDDLKFFIETEFNKKEISLLVQSEYEKLIENMQKVRS